MAYLSEMLEVQKAVDSVRVDSPRYAKCLDKRAYLQRMDETECAIANSMLSKADKDMFMDLVEGYRTNLKNKKSNNESNALKYLLVALASGGVGFGLGWYAKGAYDNYKDEQLREIVKMVKREMEK
jgi:hypothetical protein